MLIKKFLFVLCSCTMLFPFSVYAMEEGNNSYDESLINYFYSPISSLDSKQLDNFSKLFTSGDLNLLLSALHAFDWSCEDYYSLLIKGNSTKRPYIHLLLDREDITKEKIDEFLKQLFSQDIQHNYINKIYNFKDPVSGLTVNQRLQIKEKNLKAWLVKNLPSIGKFTLYGLGAAGTLYLIYRYLKNETVDSDQSALPNKPNKKLCGHENGYCGCWTTISNVIVYHKHGRFIEFTNQYGEKFTIQVSHGEYDRIKEWFEHSLGSNDSHFRVRNISADGKTFFLERISGSVCDQVKNPWFAGSNGHDVHALHGFGAQSFEDFIMKSWYAGECKTCIKNEGELSLLKQLLNNVANACNLNCQTYRDNFKGIDLDKCIERIQASPPQL